MPTLVDRVVLFRFLFVLPVFGIPAAMLLAASEWTISIAVIGLAFPLIVESILSVVYLILILRVPELRLNKVFLAVQYLLDAMLITVVIAFIDGTASPFIAVMVFLILIASITHSSQFGVTVALLASCLIAATSYMEVNGLLPWLTRPAATEIVPAILVRDFVYFGLFFVAGVLPGRMVERLQRTDRAMDLIRRDYGIIRELYRLVVERVPSGIALVDQGERALLLNRAGRQILRRLGPGDADANLRQFLARTDEALGEVQFDSDAGTRVVGYAVADLDPEVTMEGRLLIFQDVTERKELERSLEEQKRLGALGHLSASLAHELRNPLAAISNSLQILSNRLDLGEQESRLFAIQGREVQRLERLVADFLQYARPNTDDLSVVNLQDLLHAVIERTRFHPDAEHATISLSAPAAPVWVEASAGLLQQAIGNLLLNAAQWSPDGGQVAVVVQQDGHEVAVQVVDAGPGVDEAQWERIFEPFYSQRKGGTGLGLAIAWSAVQSLGGRLSLKRSRPGETVFEARLRAAEPKSVAEPLSA